MGQQSQNGATGGEWLDLRSNIRASPHQERRVVPGVDEPKTALSSVVASPEEGHESIRGGLGIEKLIELSSQNVVIGSVPGSRRRTHGAVKESHDQGRRQSLAGDVTQDDEGSRVHREDIEVVTANPPERLKLGSNF